MGKSQLEKENPEALAEIIKNQRQLIVSYQIQLYWLGLEDCREFMK